MDIYRTYIQCIQTLQYLLAVWTTAHYMLYSTVLYSTCLLLTVNIPARDGVHRA